MEKSANDAFKAGLLTPGADGVLPKGDNGTIICVEGVDVRLIGGRVMDGTVHIGTFSMKGL